MKTAAVTIQSSSESTAKVTTQSHLTANQAKSVARGVKPMKSMGRVSSMKPQKLTIPSFTKRMSSH
jgi:hypothetical protein